MAVLSLLSGAALALGQPVLQSTAPAAAVPSSLRDATKASTFALPGGSVENSAPLHWGPIELKPHLFDRFIYSDGIQATPGRQTNTYINSLSVGFGAEIGRHWTMDYTPTWMIYTNKAFQNSVDHSLTVAAGYEIGDWLTQFDQSYSKTNAPQIETGRQTSQETSQTNLSVLHRFNAHLSLEVSGAQNLQFIDKSPDYYDWSTQEWLTYRFVSRLDLSVGYRLGFTDFDPGASMTYSQPQARIRWRIADKLTLSVQGGSETRKVNKHGFSRKTTPTYSATLAYQPFDQTLLTFTAQQSVSPSYFTNSVTENKGWTADLQQRLFGRFTLSAGLSAQRSHYFGSHTEFVPSFTYTDVLDDDGNVIGFTTTVNYTPVTVIDLRNDSTRSSHIRLSTPFLGRGTVTVLYDQTRNSSDIAGFTFNSHQVGVEVGYRY